MLRPVREEDFLLIGIGVLVEILRRLGLASVAVREQELAAKADPPEPS